MQTFLPYPSFVASAHVLDYRRLGKQRVECKQMLKALAIGGGWSNHPATRMWRGYEKALSVYYNTIVIEWVRRGYKNTMPLIAWDNALEYEAPPWLGDEAFHASHRSNLIRKKPEFYGPLWDEPDDLPYVWPC